MGRAQSRNEELLNSLSHGFGLIVICIASPYLIMHAVRSGDAGFITGVSIFVATMVLLYLSSTLYHGLYDGKAKRLFHIFDHSAIFLLIAGTYTPFTLGILRGAWGWSIFGVIWGLATIGVVLKSVQRMTHPVISTGLYLLMGWLIMIAIKPLGEVASESAIFWLVMGGVAYSLGVIFHALDSKFRFAHFCWHLFVLAGTTCHYVAVYKSSP